MFFCVRISCQLREICDRKTAISTWLPALKLMGKFFVPWLWSCVTSNLSSRKKKLISHRIWMLRWICKKINFKCPLDLISRKISVRLLRIQRFWEKIKIDEISIKVLIKMTTNKGERVLFLHIFFKFVVLKCFITIKILEKKRNKKL